MLFDFIEERYLHKALLLSILLDGWKPKYEGVHLRALGKLTSSFPGNGVRLNLVQSNLFFEDEPHNGGNSRLLQPKNVSL